MTTNLKALTSNDLEAVITIDRAHTGTSRRGYFEKRLTAATDRPKDYIYVGLHIDDTLAGFAFAKLVEGEFGKPGASAALDAIGVNPAFQGQGAGRQLLAGIESILTAKSVSQIISQVDWSNQTMLGFLASAGFTLDSRMVLVRSTEVIGTADALMGEDNETLEVDFSSPDGDDPDALSNDKVLVRTMKENDLRSLISIDRKNFGTERAAYFERKQYEVLHASGIRVSLVAELDGFPVGFIMARVDYGEFGHAGQEAVMDTIGVDPGYQGHGVGQALMVQLVANLSVLQVETLRTEVAWDDTGIIHYLSNTGFRPSQQITLKHCL